MRDVSVCLVYMIGTMILIAVQHCNTIHQVKSNQIIEQDRTFIVESTGEYLISMPLPYLKAVARLHLPYSRRLGTTRRQDLRALGVEAHLVVDISGHDSGHVKVSEGVSEGA